MITINLWRSINPYYAEIIEICLGIISTPFTIVLDILFAPLEIIALIIKLLAEWYEWGKW